VPAESTYDRRERSARRTHIDFRRLAAAGLTLLGMTEACKDGTLTFKPDLAENVAQGDANYLAVLDEADAYALPQWSRSSGRAGRSGDGSDPECMTNPVLSLNLADAGVKTIIWRRATARTTVAQGRCIRRSRAPEDQRAFPPNPGLFPGTSVAVATGIGFIWASA